VYSDDHTASLTRTWAEAVIRQVARVRDLRAKASLELWQYDRMEEWSPSQEEVGQTFREQWAEEHALVWAAVQLQRWTLRLARELVDDATRERIKVKLDASKDPTLTDLRNALEHLDEADLGDFYATAKGKFSANRSLRRLPGEELQLYLGGSHSAFGHISPEALERRAQKVLEALDAESDAYTAYLVEEYLRDQ